MLPDAVEEDDDRLDAFVAASVARLAKLGHTMPPSPEQRRAARTEGWIHAPGVRPEDDRLTFLRDHEAQAAGHSGRTLLDHLLGTRQLLADWGNEHAVCDAGLFHSVYGTESYPHTTIPAGLRDRVRARIGARAERIAWLFGRRTNASFAANAGRTGGFTLEDRRTGETLEVGATDWRDLCEIFVANALEQKAAIPASRVRDVTERFLWIEEHVSVQAFTAWRRGPEGLSGASEPDRP